MKNILLALLLLPINIIPKNVLPKTQIIFSDTNYSQPTNDFSVGQTVYLKIENSGCGCSQKILRVLDNNKNEISQLTLDRAGDGPYVFTASFSAPATEEIYYVDIKIEGSGSSYANQQNINVTGNRTFIPTITPTPLPPTKPQAKWGTPTPTLAPGPQPLLQSNKLGLSPIPNFFQRFWEFLHQWFVSLTNRKH